MSGILLIDGAVELLQFWPGGLSDADTVKFTITKPATAFKFRASPGAAMVVTHVFDNAGMFETVQGKRKFKPLIRNGAITLRLQGIDAPELHVPPTVKGARDFREFQGETSTVGLGNQLKKGGKKVIQCQFVTAVNHPQEVVDKYGRFVGEIIFNRNTPNEWNICDWLVEQGWAFPAFYNSMSVAEIQRLQGKAKMAEQGRRGIWRFLSSTIGPLNWNMVFRRNGPVDAAKDRGPVVFPKMFRRLCDFAPRKKNGSVTGSLASFLGHKNTPDFCFQTKDFLAAGGRPANTLRKKLAQFVTAGDKYLATPGGLVFVEAPSKIVDRNNRPIPNTW
jgi:endonuclease YncB( thermonuclease family)